MASKLALRALGVIALPGAVLAVAAPAASAAEVAPLSNVNSGYSTQSTDSDAGAGQASTLADTSGLLSGESFSL